MNKKTVGVVVGRFQTPYLHLGHKYVLDVASSRNNDLLVVVGISRSYRGRRDPLDFETRSIMIREHYPDAVVIPLRDHMSDDVWSRDLDAYIVAEFPEHDVVLYGSRDSFLSVYSGCYHTELLESPNVELSSTQLREDASSHVVDSVQFRSGQIYTAYHSHPISFQTVDVIIRHTTEPKVLLGRKRSETKWRFPGGFVDPSDCSLELAAKREVHEEVGAIEIDALRYLGSFRIDDYRYRKSEHKIMTALFEAYYIFGRPVAGDDIVEVAWFQIDEVVDHIVDCHNQLLQAFLAQIK